MFAQFLLLQTTSKGKDTQVATSVPELMKVGIVRVNSVVKRRGRIRQNVQQDFVTFVNFMQSRIFFRKCKIAVIFFC
jgi:hypothetical protein